MLETNLNPLPISEILALGDAAKDKWITAQKDFYLILAYLDRTKRYKEDPQYRDASFDTFLRTRYGMTYTTYSETRVVLFDYPDEAEKHGPGFVRKVIKKAGRAKAKKVFEDIDKAAGSRKRPLKTADKEAVLGRHTLPKPETTKREAPRNDWELAFKQAHRRAEELQAQVRDLEDQKKVMLKENRKLTKSNAKLADKVAALQTELDDAQTMANLLQEEIADKERIIQALRIPGTPYTNNATHRPYQPSA